MPDSSRRRAQRRRRFRRRAGRRPRSPSASSRAALLRRQPCPRARAAPTVGDDVERRPVLRRLQRLGRRMAEAISRSSRQRLPDRRRLVEHDPARAGRHNEEHGPGCRPGGAAADGGERPAGIDHVVDQQDRSAGTVAATCEGAVEVSSCWTLFSIVFCGSVADLRRPARNGSPSGSASRREVGTSVGSRSDGTQVTHVGAGRGSHGRDQSGQPRHEAVVEPTGRPLAPGTRRPQPPSPDNQRSSNLGPLVGLDGASHRLVGKTW